ncbi:hypothetical protein OCC_01334 [Thermococcus litoralis DSM 5473]|uniref:Polysaccharide pyruvyl transferase domain-containing protein n=1 Tax=Thermococcus litoralis (strain ATCC 51850 / DSM 5473 / JCM 8560 / NS-C) TaxID=523849 RepID=H3ZLJ2_THELN|nr:polysaccharide pyruvyl transferase family protein [Thermococcus litoralis]EHR79130.1 hypothetical protein OCC_01334 [Thermococcus litoralis DSM 5473]MDK2853397.1 colanic acid/amylovoran biosynthesis protein [Thermococcaceae archaeon]
MRALIRIWNVFNYGEEMMLTTLVSSFSKKIGSISVIHSPNVSFEDAEGRINALFENKLNLKVHSPKIILQKSLLSYLIYYFIYYLLYLPRILLRNTYNIIIYLGGDVFSEYYFNPGLFMELAYLKLISRRKKVFLIGQTIGPFTGWKRKFARFFLREPFISVRDDWSYSYAVDTLGLAPDTVFRGSDLAFLDLPRQHSQDYSSVLGKYGLRDRRYIVLVPSGLWMKYAEDFDKYYEAWIHVIRALHDRYPQYDIVLLAHVHNPSYVSDAYVIRHIASSTPDVPMVLIHDVISPLEARIILGRSFLTITGRMHAAISTLQLGGIAVAISYSIKYDAILGERIGIPQLIIKSTPDLWESGKIVDEILNKIEYCRSNYMSIKKTIRLNVLKEKRRALSQVHWIERRIIKSLEGDVK